MNLVELDLALRKLRLSGMADVLEARLRQAQAEKLAPLDLVATLVADELQRRRCRDHGDAMPGLNQESQEDACLVGSNASPDAEDDRPASSRVDVGNVSASSHQSESGRRSNARSSGSPIPKWIRCTASTSPR